MSYFSDEYFYLTCPKCSGRVCFYLDKDDEVNKNDPEFYYWLKCWYCGKEIDDGYTENKR